MQTHRNDWIDLIRVDENAPQFNGGATIRSIQEGNENNQEIARRCNKLMSFVAEAGRGKSGIPGLENMDLGNLDTQITEQEVEDYMAAYIKGINEVYRKEGHPGVKIALYDHDDSNAAFITSLSKFSEREGGTSGKTPAYDETLQRTFPSMAFSYYNHEDKSIDLSVGFIWANIVYQKTGREIGNPHFPGKGFSVIENAYLKGAEEAGHAVTTAQDESLAQYGVLSSDIANAAVAEQYYNENPAEQAVKPILHRQYSHMRRLQQFGRIENVLSDIGDWGHRLGIKLCHKHADQNTVWEESASSGGQRQKTNKTSKEL